MAALVQYGRSSRARHILGRAKSERWNLRLKDFCIICNTNVAAVHASQGALDARATGVLKRLTGLQKWLLSDNTEASDLLSMPSSILNHPVSRNHLRRQEAAIRQGNGVGKGKHLLTCVRFMRQKLGVNGDGDAVLFHAV